MQILNYSVAIPTRQRVSRFGVEGRRVKMSAWREGPTASEAILYKDILQI